MKEITIDKESFKKYINDLYDYTTLEDNLYQLLLNYSRSSKDEAGITFPSILFMDVVSLLEAAMGDTDEWIGYFCWDLDFGKNWKPGMVTNADGSDIPMGTIDDLWNLLVNE